MVVGAIEVILSGVIIGKTVVVGAVEVNLSGLKKFVRNMWKLF